MQQCRKATVQKDTLQNGRIAEMGNKPIVLSSRVELALCNNKNKLMNTDRSNVYI